jgi:hypothetical protein
MLPERSASSISFTKSPLVPIAASGLSVTLSPVVLIITSSNVSSGYAYIKIMPTTPIIKWQAHGGFVMEVSYD